MPPNGFPNCFFAVWLLGWTLAVSVADVAMLDKAYLQTRALTLPTTEGVVTRCAVTTARDSDGPTHRLDVAYDYEVGGRRYTGTRYCYGEVGTNSRAWHRVRDDMPPGTRVRVSYEPTAPAEALLHPGATGFHLAMLWFLAPFNLVTVGGWVWMVRPRRPGFDPSDPNTVVQTATGCRVRLPALGRAARFAITLLAVTFCGIFVWGCGFGFNPPVALAGGAALAAVATAITVAVRYVPPWLEIDDVARVLRVRVQPEPVEVPFAAIRDVTATQEKWEDADGIAQRSYHCDLILADGSPIRFATHRNTVWAEALVAWLRQRIGLVSTREAQPA